MATTKATTLAHNIAHSGVTSAVLSAKAPLASPTFTGTITAPNDSISGDAVSGGTIGAGTFNGTIGSSATISTQDYMIAGLSSNQTVSHNTSTAFDFVDISDPNNWFDASTKKFQPDKAGKYCYSLSFKSYTNHGVDDASIMYAFVKKNSTSLDSTNQIILAGVDLRNREFYVIGSTGSNLVDMNGTSDYLYCVIYCNSTASSSFTVGDPSDSTRFSAFRVGP